MSSTTKPAPPALWKEFVCGTLAACCAGVVVHPIDLVKVRMQLHGSGGAQVGATVTAPKRQTLIGTGLNVMKSEGPLAIYRGLSANLLRQCTYIGTKFGFYNVLKMQVVDKDGNLSFAGKCGCGLGAGAIGAVVGTPADMCMVRMQADGRLPPAERRNYKNGFDALRRVVAEEGVLTLWRGCLPTVQRGMLITAAQLAVYDDVKGRFKDTFQMNEGLPLHFSASMVAAAVASLVSNPIDVAKTRLQNMRPVDGVMPYKNMVDCLLQTTRQEGPLAIYKGLGPTFARQAPLNVTIFVVVERLRWSLFGYRK